MGAQASAEAQAALLGARQARRRIEATQQLVNDVCTELAAIEPEELVKVVTAVVERTSGISIAS